MKTLKLALIILLFFGIAKPINRTIVFNIDDEYARFILNHYKKQMMQPKKDKTLSKIKNTSNSWFKLEDKIYTAGRLAKNVIKFGYDYSDLILSKKTLKAFMLVAAPYLYFHPRAMEALSKFGSDFIIKMNGMIAEGIIKGVASNPVATSKIMGMLTVEKTGIEIASHVAKKLASLLVWGITLGKFQ